MRTMWLRVCGIVLVLALPAVSEYLDLRNSTVGPGNTVITPASGWFGSSPLAGNVDAFFKVNDQQSTGTGVLDPFVRIQGGDSEQGFNTSVNTQMDNKDGIWTHPLLLSDLATVVVDGVTYYQFVLDINQQNATPFLSLDSLQVRTGTTGAMTTANLGSQTLIYDMDTAGTCREGNALADCTTQIATGTVNHNLPTGNGLLLDYDDNRGSGSGDLFFYLPKALVDTNKGASDTYLYLYSRFGDVGGPFSNGLNGQNRIEADFRANDGFEEWAALTGATVVPEPSSYAALLGLGMGALFVVRKRFVK